MTVRLTRSLMSLAALATVWANGAAQTTSPLPERAIRRDIPLTNAIRRAFGAGTRSNRCSPTSSAPTAFKFSKVCSTVSPVMWGATAASPNPNVPSASLRPK